MNDRFLQGKVHCMSYIVVIPLWLRTSEEPSLLIPIANIVTLFILLQDFIDVVSSSV